MQQKLNIIAMIPARYEASRFPGKLMHDLGGIPVILRTYNATVETGLFDNVYVVTDSQKIYDTIINAGGNAVFSIKEHECGSDRIAEAVADLDIDIVVNVQGDEPFTNREDLANVLKVFAEDIDHRIDLASLMTPITDWDEIQNPNNVKVMVDQQDFAIYFSRSVIPYPRNTEIKITYYKHKGIYAFRKQAILDFYKLPMSPLEAAEKIECIRYLEYGKTIKMVRSNLPAIGIDTAEDLERARLILKEQNS